MRNLLIGFLLSLAGPALAQPSPSPFYDEAGSGVTSGGEATGDITLGAYDLYLDVGSKAYFDGDQATPNDYIYASANGVLDVVAAGGYRLRALAAGVEINNSLVLRWGSDRAVVSSPADGNILLTDAAGTDFGLLQLGGTTNAFPAIRRSATGLQLRLADNSAYTSLTLSSLAAESTVYTYSAKGARTTVTDPDNNAESVTFAANPGDASKVTTGTAIPDGCYLIGVTTRVTTAGTNCSGYHVGISGGGDDDQFGADIAVTAGTTSDNTDVTATFANPVLADKEIVITGTDGAGGATNCYDLVVAITTHCLSVSAATSN
jgi:hypothetical protein